jgi:hypothetical protein
MPPCHPSKTENHLFVTKTCFFDVKICQDFLGGYRPIPSSLPIVANTFEKKPFGAGIGLSTEVATKVAVRGSCRTTGLDTAVATGILLTTVAVSLAGLVTCFNSGVFATGTTSSTGMDWGFGVTSTTVGITPSGGVAFSTQLFHDLLLIW